MPPDGWNGLPLMRAEKAAAHESADRENGHNGRSEGEKAGNEAVKGAE
jgi:hypothetical protein